MHKHVARFTTLVLCLMMFASPAWSAPKEQAFNEIFNILQENFVNEVDSEKLYEGAIKGMLESLNDPYTVYFDTYGFQSFNESFESNFSGIGVQIKAHKLGVQIVSVFKNSPAQKAGLLANDVITIASGEKLAGKSVDYVTDLIRGAKGTKLALKFQRVNKSFFVTIVRATIANPGVEYKMMGKYGYLKINEFKKDSAKNTAEALKYFNSHKAQGLVLDLRDDPGGELNEALNICEQLLPAGPMIQILNSDGNKQVIVGEGKGYGKPIVALVNGGSASASEIVAGALQDRKAGLLIGEKTFGKASVQSIIPLESGGGLKITIAHYLTPNGRYIHGKGISPDLNVKTDPKEDLVLKKALALLNKGMVAFPKK